MRRATPETSSLPRSAASGDCGASLTDIHHRLVAIHPFPNGNGRHARVFADLLMRTLDGEQFTWGATSIQGNGPNRQAYLDALRAADADPENIEPLVLFARS